MKAIRWSSRHCRCGWVQRAGAGGRPPDQTIRISSVPRPALRPTSRRATRGKADRTLGQDGRSRERDGSNGSLAVGARRQGGAGSRC